MNALPVPGAACVAVGAYLLWQQGFRFAWSTLWAVLVIWFGVGLLSSGFALLLDAPRLYCKRSDGTLPAAIWLHLGGWLAIYRGNWLLKQAFCLRVEDRAFDRVAPQLLIGRLLAELPVCKGEPEVDMVVDVTCEWTETEALRGVPQYVPFPVVDTTRPTVSDTLRIADTVVRHLENPGAGSVYIHCANGYGRSAVVMAAVLLARGTCDTPEEAMDLVQAARPVVSFRHRRTRGKACCEIMTQSQVVEAIADELQRRRGPRWLQTGCSSGAISSNPPRKDEEAALLCASCRC